MAYRIENNKIIFDEPPRAGQEVKITVSTQQSVRGFADPRGYYPRRLNEPDTNRLAVNDKINQHPVVQYKKSRVDDLTGEPKTPYNAQYPYNHVRETESGHIQEFDDTPGFERIHEFHKSGTFYEVHPDGTKVTKVVGEDYEIVLQNKKMRVRGNVEIYVDGNTNLYCRGSMNGQVDEDMTWNVGRNITFHAGQNIRMYSNQSTEITAQQQITATSVGNMKLQTQADFIHSVDGDYQTNIKGNFGLSADAAGTMLFGTTYDLLADAAMSIDSNSTLDINIAGAIDMRGATVDLNKGSPSPGAYSQVPDIEFFDSRGVATYDEGVVVGAPVEAIVLPAKARTETADTNAYHGNDDVELSLDDKRAAITRGDYLPMNFQDYSFNALQGTFNVDNIMRRVQAQPRVPDSPGEHDDEDTVGTVRRPEAQNTTVAPVDDVVLANGIDYNLMISRHFKLGDFSKNAYFGHNLAAQHGLTVEQIINNLSVLATNAIDLIKDQYPSMRINSGFRPASGSSQHERGQACDMQFTGITPRQYIDLAEWIVQNVPFDQFLLEYSANRTAWLHLSCKVEGNRSLYGTFFDHSRYGDWGRLYQLA